MNEILWRCWRLTWRPAFEVWSRDRRGRHRVHRGGCSAPPRWDWFEHIVFVKRSKNLKTSHSVTVREGWVMSANLAGLRTLNNQSWWWRQNACDDDHNEDKVVEGVTDNWHSPVLSPSVLSRGLVALLVGLDPRIVGNKYRFIHQNIFSLRAWSYPSDQWHQE